MTRGKTKGMKFEKWPELDQIAWRAATRPGDWLDAPGRGASWRPKSQLKFADAYGHWLSWLTEEGLLVGSDRPRIRITEERIWSYARWMLERVAPVTAWSRIVDLEIVAKAFAPDDELPSFKKLIQWMPKAPSVDKRLKLREPAELHQLGLDLMKRAEAGGCSSRLRNAVAYRDGLMISLAAWRPLRCRNLCDLHLHLHLRIERGSLRILIPAEETKTGKAISMTWPEGLRRALDRYVDHWRPFLIGGAQDHRRLWVSSRGGGQLASHTLACNFRSRTLEAFGVAISPHRFRDAAATMLAIHKPEHVRAGAAVLGHARYETTQRHYNQARSLQAVRTLHACLDELMTPPGRETSS